MSSFMSNVSNFEIEGVVSVVSVVSCLEMDDWKIDLTTQMHVEALKLYSPLN